jgi:hypothetical protein
MNESNYSIDSTGFLNKERDITRILQTFGFEVTTESLILGIGRGRGGERGVPAAAFGLSWKTWQL